MSIKSISLDIFFFCKEDEKMIEQVKNAKPLIHCITNKVTMNDCANALLAIGGSPIMADDEAEVEDITSICQGLLINIGTLNQATIPSMMKAGKKANALQHPVLLDPVGIGASQLRYQTTQQLLKEVHFDVIRGNISEMKALMNIQSQSRGVDANASDSITDENLDENIIWLQQLSSKTGAIIAVSGAIDVIVDSQNAYIVRNGCQEMSMITGTGCILSAIMSAFMVVHRQRLLEACTYVSALMGYCGELAKNKMLVEKLGVGSLRVYLMDYLSLINDGILKEGMKIEKRC